MFDEMFNETMRKAAENFELHPGDYEKDGEIYCGKCHTKRAFFQVHPIDGEKVGKVLTYCYCKCADEERTRQEKLRKQAERAARIMQMKSVGFTDAVMKDWTFAKDDKANSKVSELAMKYVQKFDTAREKGNGLILCGTVGTGKTFIAACIVNALIERGVPCLMTNFTRIINTLSGMRENKQGYIDKINDCDLLVIDDFSVERQTEYAQEIVYEVIDSRYRTGYPLIVTTNLTRQELLSPATVAKQRIYSRLLSKCLIVEIKGKDRRTDWKRNGEMVDFARELGL